MMTFQPNPNRFEIQKKVSLLLSGKQFETELLFLNLTEKIELYNEARHKLAVLNQVSECEEIRGVGFAKRN